MTFWKRIFPYLLLNIVISAATTLIVLTVWDRVQHPVLPAGSGGIPEAASPDGASQEASREPAGLPPLDIPVIHIETVIGAGDLAFESVHLQRVGEGDLQLAGWRLSGSNQEYIFPDLTLNKNGSIRLHTRAGQSTVIELYWGLEKAAWKPGDTITLYDSAGNQRASYTIP